MLPSSIVFNTKLYLLNAFAVVLVGQRLRPKRRVTVTNRYVGTTPPSCLKKGGKRHNAEKSVSFCDLVQVMTYEDLKDSSSDETRAQDVNQQKPISAVWTPPSVKSKQEQLKTRFKLVVPPKQEETVTPKHRLSRSSTVSWLDMLEEEPVRRTVQPKPTPTQSDYQPTVEETRDFLFAAGHGDLERVKEFLNLSNKVNIRDEFGRTALMAAAESGMKDVVKFLVETYNANIEARDSTGRTAVMWAADLGQMDMVRMLRQYLSA